MAEELVPFEFPLKGKLITSKNPTVIGENFQSLKNLRYKGAYPEGIGGMTPVNSSAPTTGGTSHTKIKSAVHFRKEGETTDYEHLLVYTYQEGMLNPKIFKHSVDAPTTGDFTTTPIFTLSDTTTEREGHFSDGANGTVVFCDGNESLLWGGDEYQLGRFINFTTSGGTNKDYTEALRNSLTDTKNRAILTKATTMLFYVGATRPISGFKCYFDNISTKNNSTGTLAVSYWNGSAWTAVSSLVDGTSSGNKPLRATASVSFTSTVSTSKPRIIDGIALHWYRVSSSGVATNSHMGKLTVNAPMQKITDIWDGDIREAVSFQLNNATDYTEYAANVLDDDYVVNSSQTWVNIAGASYHVVCGFLDRTMGVQFHIIDGSGNNNASTLTVQYSSNGKEWTNVSGLIDNTSSGGKSMRVSGIVSWNPPDYNTEFETSVDTVDLYWYYKFTWSAQLSATKVYYVAGIPAPKEIRNYQYPVFAKNRIWLLNNTGGKKNSAICCSQNAPNVWNGDDAEEIFFGDESELRGGVQLYSIVGSSVFDVVLFFKRHALYAITGGEPEDFTKYEINITDGLIAVRTLQKAITLIGDMPRNVVLWQGAKGIYMFDNRSYVPIHDDISNFFDPRETSTRKLHSSYIENSVGFVDQERFEYHWLFADGSSTGNLNREFVFNLINGQWFEIDRGSSGDLQFGFNVMDTNSNRYTYGIRNNGIMTRLENSVTFNSNSINHELWTGDVAIDKGRISNLLGLRKLKLIAKSTTLTSNSLLIRHYIDGNKTASSSFTLSPLRTGYNWIDAKKSMKGQPFGMMHSIRLNMNTTNETYGFTPIYLAGFFERIREDI